MDEGLKDKLEQAYKILYMEGLAEDTTRGHITARTEDNRIYIKPWGVGFEEVTAQDFLCVDPDGNLLEKKGRLHSELPLHLEIYRKRKDVFSVIHVHPQYSVILSSLFREKMQVIGHSGVHFLGTVPFYPSAALIHSKEQGAELAQVMGERLWVLMKNHGIVTAGRSLEEAVILAIDFENAAKEHLIVSLLGKGTEIPMEVAEKMNSRIYNRDQYEMMWNYYCRKLGRRKI